MVGRPLRSGFSCGSRCGQRRCPSSRRRSRRGRPVARWGSGCGCCLRSAGVLLRLAIMVFPSLVSARGGRSREGCGGRLGGFLEAARPIHVLNGHDEQLLKIQRDDFSRGRLSHWWYALHPPGKRQNRAAAQRRSWFSLSVRARRGDTLPVTRQGHVQFAHSTAYTARRCLLDAKFIVTQENS
jgi:hypothetical protein